MFLDGVVCQMDKRIVSLIQVILMRAHSYVTLLEVEALVFMSDKHPKSNVKFTL